VDVLEAELAERPLRALRRAAEDHVLRHRREVAQLLQILRAGGVLGDHEPVLVCRVGGIEDGETVRVERFLQSGRGLRLVRGGLRDLAVLVHERQQGRKVLGHDVDLPGLDRRIHDLAVSEIELARHLVTVRLEDLGVELAQRDLLVEVGRAHDDRGTSRGRRSRASGPGAATGRRHQGDREKGGKNGRSALHGILPGPQRLGFRPSRKYDRQRAGHSGNVYGLTVIPGGADARASAANATSVTIARSATSSAPATSWSYSWSARPSTMKRPSAPPATIAPSVAVATTFTAAVPIPPSMSGRPSGISIVPRISDSLRPIPRAASTTSRSTSRIATNVLVMIGGIASGTRANIVGQKPRPSPSGMAIAKPSPMSASDGSARPMFARLIAMKPPRPV